jgi:hypothetical protein
MATPDIAKLDLSDSSDAEDLFASPSRTSKPTKTPTANASESTNAPPQRNTESKYDTEQARTNALQKELESVRSINEVIEGVISSLECAKGNMDVRITLSGQFMRTPQLMIDTDRFAHSHISIHSSQHLDSHSLADRT